MSVLHDNLPWLLSRFRGDIFLDESTLLMYSTDASVYREKPLAVARPKVKEDIRILIEFARQHRLPLIPRTAGTSLAGQVVGSGIVVDVSRYMTRVLEINPEERWVRVEPGVVLDELNKTLEPYGLFFGPETSTSNRCMIGGMVGNNSCGAHSILYGSTRDHTLAVKGYLSDGSEVHFHDIDVHEFDKKCRPDTLEGEIYRHISGMLKDAAVREEIRKEYPHPDIKRRNTGYAIDLLLDMEPFIEEGASHTGSGERKWFNFSKLIAGSEGTLVFMTEITLNLVPLPPKEKALVCVHCHTLEEAFEGNLVALKFKPASVELIDHIIIECTKENITQRKNRFFIEGEPAAILVVEFMSEIGEEIDQLTRAMEKAFREAGYGYHFPVVKGPDMNKVWALRKAGLGLLSNVPGDAKPVTMIEDTAVSPQDLPSYMKDFMKILDQNGLDCVYYAHIATGELHLKPVLDLKNPHDRELFRKVPTEIAHIVKKYRGSLSGEHGDGRLRGEFVPLMIGEKNFELLKEIKRTWDPVGIFNPGKITGTPPMDAFLRYQTGQKVREIQTYLDFSTSKGILRAVEQCNGSGDCRKSEIIGGTMCPSYMATRNEKNTTRARANVLREFLTNSHKVNPFDHQEIKDILDLCLSCKGCKSECPSNVDMAKYKAEFLQQWYDVHGVPFRSRMISKIGSIHRKAMILPAVYNFSVTNPVLSWLIKRMLGFAPQRPLPRIYRHSLKRWMRKTFSGIPASLSSQGKVMFFLDEFTNYQDVEIGMKAVMLLKRLGYEVEVPEHVESGRAHISKGMLKKARKLADQNVELLKDQVSRETPLLGIEPSAILSFRDEYPDLVSDPLKADARRLAPNCLLVEEFLWKEYEAGHIRQDQFSSVPRQILYHGHCQQKSLASTLPARKVMEIPMNYRVEEIASGCCGMAGSFGYESEHYELSMKVGELVLFPAIRNSAAESIVAASGTSCRHHIYDGTGRQALHPVEVLYNAMI